MNNRLEKIFSENKSVLIPFITAGFPRLTTTLPLLFSMAENGAPIIEIGVPFSDPMADGPIIEAAGNTAINNGVNLVWILKVVREFRKVNSKTGIVLMGYQNSFEQFPSGINNLVKEFVSCGVDGVLIVDNPPEESNDLYKLLNNHNLCIIRLLSPTTPGTRIAKIIKTARGYLYLVSLKGVTGSSALNVELVKKQVQDIKKQTSLPIAVGFGVRGRDNVQALAKFADGVIIGSKLIEIINENINKSDGEIAKVIGNFIKEII